MSPASLDAALARLYAVFEHYPLKPRIEGCPHCELASNERSLHAAPLRRLSEEHFGRYPFKAMTTFGDEEDFKHFLPRIAELIAREGSVGACDTMTFASKLAYAGFGDWTAPERDAVLAWIAALAEARMCGAPHVPVFLRDLRDACRTLTGDDAALLARWTRATSPDAIEELADVVLEASRGDEALARTLLPHREALLAAFVERGAGETVQLAFDALGFPPFAPP